MSSGLSDLLYRRPYSDPEAKKRLRSEDELLHLDLVITEFCTRKCRDCSNLMQYYHKPEHLSADNVISDLGKVLGVLRVHELKILGGDESLSDMVESMRSTLVGIMKHLQQLKDGRFQYDLYAFVLPAFEALPQITENITSLILQIQDKCARRGETFRQELQKAGNDTICYLLDRYIHDISRLLTELQHLFSVLSISPHTYLESYGSNMRSITATCKLLVAYQGIAYCLSTHFSMELLTVRGDRVQANEVMLVIPYRRIHQSTRVLFESTSPENRIVYIRINASDMFDVQKTLSMLLHECGHHILSRDFRENRIEYFFRAFTGYLLDQVFGSTYRDPKKSIQMPLTSRKDFIRENDLSQKIHIKSESEDFLKECIILELRSKQHIDKDIMDYWEREYKRLDRIQAIAEPVTLNNDLLYHVKDAACSYIEGKLSELKEGESSKAFCSINRFSYHIGELVGLVIKLFISVLDEEYEERSNNDDSELWHLSELRTVYRTYPEERVTKYVEFACLDVIEHSYKDIAEELKNIFSDIYSDIFAFSMLRTWQLSDNEKKDEARKYITLLRDEAGFMIQEEFSHGFLLVRIIAVLQEYFGISPEEADDIVVSVLSLLPEESAAIRKKMSYTRNRIGFEAVLGFTKELCIPYIREQIEHSESLIKDTQELFNMYHNAADRNNLESLINAIFYFWKASTERNKEL